MTAGDGDANAELACLARTVPQQYDEGLPCFPASTADMQAYELGFSQLTCSTPGVYACSMAADLLWFRQLPLRLLLVNSCNTCTMLQVRLRIWRLQHGLAVDNPVLDCSSTSGALEVGGGPWDSCWSAEAAMREPLKSIVKVPLNVEGIVSAIPGKWRPPGL